MGGDDPDCELGTTTTTKSVDTLAHVQPSAGVHRESPSSIQGNSLEGYLPYLLGAIVLTAIIFVVLRSSRLRRMEHKKKEEEEKLRIWTEEQLRNGEDPELLKKALEGQGTDPAVVDEFMKRL